MAKVFSADNLPSPSWILVTCIGSVSGFILGGSLGDYFEEDFLPLYVLVLNVCCGLLVGLGQWTILHRKLKNVWMWIPVPTIGLPLGFVVGFLIGEIYIRLNVYNEWVNVIILPSIAGMFTGMLQWLALGRNLRESFGWIIVSGVSWGIGITASLAINFDFSNWLLGNLMTGAVMGILAGVISGAFIKPLLLTPSELEGNDS